MLDVVTVWAPRPAHPKYGDYLTLLRLQRACARRLGHRHIVVTDCEALDGFDTLRAGVSESLMRAILEGQLAWAEQWGGEWPAVLMDVDCLPLIDLERAFDRSFDIGLTSRRDARSPVQNGVMYFAAGSQNAARTLFRRALELCGEHWGGDQEAISQVVAPVPQPTMVGERLGVRVAFLSTDTHNFTPKIPPLKMPQGRYVLHLKGEERKGWAAPFARQFLRIAA